MNIEEWAKSASIWEFIFPVALPIIAIMAVIYAVAKSWQVISQFVKTVNSLVKLPEFIEATDERLKSLSDGLSKMGAGSHEILVSVEERLRVFETQFREEVDGLGRILDSVSSEVKEIHHQTHTNGGGSIKDVVTVMNADITTIKSQMDKLCKERK